MEVTLDAMVVPPPSRTSEEAHHLCLDKGYDNPTGHRTVEDYGYTGHVRRIGEEKLDEVGQKTHPARRWVVERTLAWLSKLRSVLVRYEVKDENYLGEVKDENYLGLVKLACVLIWTRIWHRLKAQPDD